MEYFGDVVEINMSVMRVVRCAMGVELDEQIIDFVAKRNRLFRFAEVTRDQGVKIFFGGEMRCLKQLAQLEDLDFVVHFVEPIANALHQFRFSTVDGALKFSAWTY